MQWKNLFTPVANLSVAEARAFMDQRSTGDYELLDVRQPNEYQQTHIPGSRLIPLGELPARLGELDRRKPVIAYCAVGGRSKAAAQYLAGQGFSEVYNLAGGIKVWDGGKVGGALESGLELLPVEAEFGDALQLAFAMEEGSQHFYQHLEAAAATDELRHLFNRLAGFEERHKARLASLFKEKEGRELDAALAAATVGIMEGGGRLADQVAALPGGPDQITAVLDFAMALETQAYDLYGRLVLHSKNESAKSLFIGLMDEERTHLGFLSRELEGLLSRR